jgi:ferredoxin-type protein NapG
MNDERPISRRDMLRTRLVGGVVRWATAAATMGLDLAGQLSCANGNDSGKPWRITRVEHGEGESAPHRDAPRRKADHPLPVLRPPGAVDEARFLAECTRCDACLKACPFQAIVHAPARFRAAAGTPMIDPAQQPCRMCAEMPCVTACEAGVLRGDWPRVMAKVRIDELACLAHEGLSCSSCVEQCPVEGAMKLQGGKPVIDGDRCTGCGVCQYVCPAPSHAVLLMPVADRARAEVGEGKMVEVE